MKRALALLAVASMFGFVGLAQGELTGQWDFSMSVGFRDVVITDPGATITIPGGTYTVSQGFVTIGDRVVSGTYQGSSYTVTVPGGTYLVGPWTLTIAGGTYAVSDGTVTIPSQNVTLQLPDGECTVTVPGYEFEVPDFANKEVDILVAAADKDYPIDPPEVLYSYSGTVHYTYVLYEQTSSTVIQEGEGFLELEEQEGTVSGLTWDCANLCWTGWPATVVLDAFHRELHPDGKTFQVDFDPVDVTVKCDDAIDNGQLLIVGRKAYGTDSIGNVVEITLDAHPLNFSIKEPAFTYQQNWGYTPVAFEGQHWLFVKIPDTDFDVVMPDGWPWCCEDAPIVVPRPTVTIGWEDLDTAVYQYTGDATELEAIKADVEANGELVLDKIGFGFLNTEFNTYEVEEDCSVEIPQGDIEGTFLLGSYSTGMVTIVLPERTATCTIEGEAVTITIPEQTVTVSGQTVTIPDQTVTVEADSIVIPDYTFTITIEDQQIDITVPGGTYAVSNQTVTIPDKTITIPGWSQTIEKMLDVSFTTSLTLNYTIAGWTFTSVSTFEDAGFTAQEFSIAGSVGPVAVEGSMEFDPSVPSYTESSLKASVTFAGVETSLTVDHTPALMTYTLEASADPFSAKLVFEDPCTGIKFKSTTITLSGLGLCCGITYDVEFAFTKAGFDYVSFTAKNLFPICCGISFDLSVKFTTDYKEVSIKPVLAKIADTCFTLYADLDWSNNAIGALEIYGWKVKCELAECNYIEFLTALDVAKVEEILDADVFKGDEFQYAKLGFCGPGCCGGSYTVDLAIYFDNGGGLFGISRFGADLAIPVMSNFTFKAGFSTLEPTLTFGWTFTF